MKYDFKTIEEKWNLSEPVSGKTKKGNYYVLDMFPYPSGEGLHMGHTRIYTASDVYSRWRRLNGYDVLHPTGWDAFGLPAEQYAIKTKTHPRAIVAANTERFRAQMKKLNFAYDWDREVNTTDPKFYKWTQWAFLKMFEQGLCYESFEPINWCPSCKTGLANEDLENGRCERCGSIVEKKPMRQWMIRMTDYAERLLQDLDTLPWSESFKEAQRNWIGKSEGAEIDFNISGTDDVLTVFTTRADTLFGASYVVVAPEHAFIHSHEDKIKNISEVKEYVEAAAKKTDIDRTAEGREKTGIRLDGVSAINPVNNEELPIFVADYVLGDYGTGAVMAVPAHDERDFAFAKKYNLPIKQVIAPETGNPHEEEQRVHGGCAIVFDPKEQKYAVLMQDSGFMRLCSGNVNEGEDEKTGILREVNEESGLHDFAYTEKIADAYVHFYNTLKKSYRAGWAACYLVILNSAEAKEQQLEAHEKFSLSWVSADELKDNWLGFNAKHDVDHWLWFLQQAVAKAIELGYDKTSSASIYKEEAYIGEGKLVNSDSLNGMNSLEARSKILKLCNGRKKIRYKLRDWVFSRQRYWGEPIPIIHCEACGVVPVPEKDLPVVLPDIEAYEPTGTGESPLANISEWVTTTCPKCGGAGKRETNTMPQWAGSSWYFLRYIDPNNDKKLVDPKLEKDWMPVDTYIGGNEHLTRHLIYARFWHKFLYDIKVVSEPEPFGELKTVGLILAEDGRKMSKRWGNVINPDEMAERFGVDALRLYMMFIGPFEQPAAFLEAGVAGAKSFLNRVCLLFDKISKNAKEKDETVILLNQTIKKVGEDIEAFKFNTAVSAMMILANALGELEEVNSETLGIFVRLLAPFAPQVAEELWHELGNKDSIFRSSWPEYDETKLLNENATIVVQVNGKLRDSFEIARDASEEEVKQTALERETVKKWVDGQEIKKIIVVKGKIVNIVV